VIWRFNILGLRDFTGGLTGRRRGHRTDRSRTMRVLQIVHGNEAGGVKTLSEIIGGGLAAQASRSRPACLFPDPRAGASAACGHMARRAADRRRAL